MSKLKITRRTVEVREKMQQFWNKFP